MEDDYELGYPASDVLQKLNWIENSDKILLDARWGIANVLFDLDWRDSPDCHRQTYAIDQALQSAEDALRLVIEVLGEDVQVDWFWNSCQGHYAEITARERESNAFKDLCRQETASSATGGTIAIAIVTALVRVKGRLNKIADEKKVKTAPEDASA